jgi:hypothetical protein
VAHKNENEKIIMKSTILLLLFLPCYWSFQTPSVRPIPVVTEEKETSSLHYIAHRGRAAHFMPFWPSPCTFTLIQGWSKEDTLKLERAVKAVAMANPVLAGKAEVVRGHQGPIIRVVASDHKQELFKVIAPPKNTPSPKGISDSNLLEYMDQYVVPLVEPLENVGEVIKEGKPQFQMELIELPDNHAVYVMRLSHCVGDGITYYHLMQQLNAAFHSKEPKPYIDWDDSSIATHEIYSPEFNACDFYTSYGLPFMVGATRNILDMESRPPGYLLISSAEVQSKRKELCDSSKHRFLSANDVITASLCAAIRSSDVINFTMDVRKKNRHVGGNFYREIPFDRKAVDGDPNRFRDILEKGHYYERGQVPLYPSLLGRVGRITSLASIVKWIEGENQTVLCHCLPKTFGLNVPLDVGFVFRMSKDKYVVLHNYKELKIDEGGLLQEVVVGNDYSL